GNYLICRLECTKSCTEFWTSVGGLFAATLKRFTEFSHPATSPRLLPRVYNNDDTHLHAGRNHEVPTTANHCRFMGYSLARCQDPPLVLLCFENASRMSG